MIFGEQREVEFARISEIEFKKGRVVSALYLGFLASKISRQNLTEAGKFNPDPLLNWHGRSFAFLWD